MPQEKKPVDCIARLEVGSADYIIVQALRILHKEKGNYDFLDMEDLKKKLDDKTRITLNDPENGNLDRLRKMRIVELNTDDFTLCIHSDHQVKFVELN